MVFKKSEPVTTDSGNPIHLLSSQEQSHKRCVQTYFCPKKNFRKIGLFVYYQIRYMQLTRWTIACVTIFGCNSLCSIVCKFRWHWKKVYKWVQKLLKITRTMLQNRSKSEVKASQCGNLKVLLPLRFYVKSSFGEIFRSKISF